jgi:uncharacterized protein (TIGR00725 family)
MRVSVIGGSTVSDPTYEQARELGRHLGRHGHEIICGGLAGVMEGVCRGGQETNSHTVGILPGSDRGAANRYVETAIATGMGTARNALVVLNGDAVVAIDGSTGTLSELGLALDYGRPVAGLETHRIDGVEHVDSPELAVEFIESAVESL